MVLQEGEELLGIKGFTPERGLFNILLQETGIYRLTDKETYGFGAPRAENLLSLWKTTDSMFKKVKRAVSLADVYEQWSKPPFGIKA